MSRKSEIRDAAAPSQRGKKLGKPAKYRRQMQHLSSFGSWVDRIEEVCCWHARACVHQSCNRDEQFAASFHSAQPYPHVAIPEFFSSAFAAELAQKFPSPEISKAGWFLYNNPIEIKFANNDRASLPACFNSAIDLLNSEQTRSLVSAISGVPFLEEVITILCFGSLCIYSSFLGPSSSRRRHPLPPPRRQARHASGLHPRLGLLRSLSDWLRCRTTAFIL
jgi:hypothetical protein